MKAWIIFSPYEWATLMHADTRGKAIYMALYHVDGDHQDFPEFRAKRFPELDNKPFTYQDCLDAGFWYEGVPADTFWNDCPCPICKGE